MAWRLIQFCDWVRVLVKSVALPAAGFFGSVKFAKEVNYQALIQLLECF